MFLRHFSKTFLAFFLKKLIILGHKKEQQASFFSKIHYLSFFTFSCLGGVFDDDEFLLFLVFDSTLVAKMARKKILPAAETIVCIQTFKNNWLNIFQ